MINLSPIRSEQIEDLIRREALTTPHPWSEAALRGSLQGGANCLLIQQDELNVGYLVVQSVEDEAELLNLVIFHPYGSQGHGRAAMLALQRRLRDAGIHTLHLEVRAANTIARTLYEKTGFTQLGVRAAYYPGSTPDEGRDDAILMCCRCA